MSIFKPSFDQFKNFYNSLNEKKEYDIEFLYSLFESQIDSYNDNLSSSAVDSIFSNINPYQLFLYLFSEYKYVTYYKTEEEINKINDDDNFLSTIISISLDKYLTNEKIDLNETYFATKYSPNISTLSLYLNFMTKITLNFSKRNPHESLLADILMKCINISRCSLDLLVDGFENESLSVWRTLHETECILYLLIKYKQPMIEKYLKHMNYAMAYRHMFDVEKTDKIFENIKSEMKDLNLKSKDMKKYIEYGYLFAIPDIKLDVDFKLNFRDGVEKLADLQQYSKLYEYSSEIAHSSPLMLYSNERYLFHLTLISLYEVFFRIEKVFSSYYLANLTDDVIKNNYLQMRNIYYAQMRAIYINEKNIYENLTKKAD